MFAVTVQVAAMSAAKSTDADGRTHFEGQATLEVVTDDFEREPIDTFHLPITSEALYNKLTFGKKLTLVLVDAALPVRNTSLDMHTEPQPEPRDCTTCGRTHTTYCVACDYGKVWGKPHIKWAPRIIVAARNCHNCTHEFDMDVALGVGGSICEGCINSDVQPIAYRNWGPKPESPLLRRTGEAEEFDKPRGSNATEG